MLITADILTGNSIIKSVSQNRRIAVSNSLFQLLLLLTLQRLSAQERPLLFNIGCQNRHQIILAMQRSEIGRGDFGISILGLVFEMDQVVDGVAF
jgi:hypothetical protein